MGPLICRCFSIVNTIALHHPQLVESKDVESKIQRNLGYRGPSVSYTQLFKYTEGQCP